MKQYIILLSMIMLGICIFNLIAGSGENSIKSTMHNVWEQEIEIKTLKGAPQ